MQDKRIIYFQQNLSLGACEEYFYLLMQGMDKNRFNITFACPKESVLDSLAAKVQALDIQVYRYPTDISNYSRIMNLVSFFRKLKPVLVHFNDPCLNGIIAARLASVPVLVMTHHTPELNRIYSLKGRFLERIAFRHCGIYTIFTSEYDRDTGIRKDKISKERSSVIYYGLSPEEFSHEYDKKEIYTEFALHEDCRIIANIARLSPQKGQNYLIQAAPFVIERFKSIKFFFIGEGELESKLKSQVKERGLEDFFLFTGYRTDIPRILSAIEVLVMPSLFEGLCFAVIEASAMGIPVIATATGGMRRSVIDGKTGLLISVGNPQVLANTIIWMLEHPAEAKQMGEEGKKYFKEQFTQERMVNETEQLYEYLLTKFAPKY
jgi:glycosyltransferase involved in cell wall biosynthesis